MFKCFWKEGGTTVKAIALRNQKLKYKTGFLWFPKTIEGTKRWACWANWSEIQLFNAYKDNKNSGVTKAYWVPHHWVDDMAYNKLFDGYKNCSECGGSMKYIETSEWEAKLTHKHQCGWCNRIKYTDKMYR